MRNPFRYGSKVTGGEFYDRIEIKKSILNVIDGGNNVVLYGPRRYGKSSLMAEVVEHLQTQGVLCVCLNLMDIASLNDFVLSYSRAVYRVAAPKASALRHVAELFKRLRPVLGFDESGSPELSFQFAARKMGAQELREVLALPQALCPRERQMVIVLDEFQEVASLGLGAKFEQIMRSVIESHTDISYVFLGSKCHLMKRMFLLPARPFYRSAQTFSLSLPPPDESAAFLVEKFRAVKMRLSAELASAMVEKAGNVPYYLQALGSWVFRMVSERSGKDVTSSDVQTGFGLMYEAERELFENVFQSLPESQRLVARAIAQEPVAQFSEDYRARHFLPLPSTVNTAIRRLVDDSRIDSLDGVYRIVDPLLAHHLRVSAAT